MADLFLHAMDHRDSLVNGVYGISGEPTPEETRRIEAGKVLLFRGLHEALVRGADPGTTGVLVDERYGERVATEVREAALTLAMPIERSGQAWFTLEYGTMSDQEWLDHVERFDPDYVKVLVRDNPDFAVTPRRAQMEDLASITAGLQNVDRKLLVELVVPPTPAQNTEFGHRYDDELRPELTERIIGEFQDEGVEPAIWKIEGMNAPEDASAVLATARAGGRDEVECIVLGRAASQENLDRWLRAEAPVGYSGFAIGRSTWERPLVDLLAHRIEEDEMITQVADNYLHFVRVYEQAERSS